MADPGPRRGVTARPWRAHSPCGGPCAVITFSNERQEPPLCPPASGHARRAPCRLRGRSARARRPVTGNAPDRLSQDMQFRILRLLQQDPHLSQRDLADRLGISLGRLNACLRALLQAGLVSFSDFTAASDRRRYAYRLTPRGLALKASLSPGFLRRKLAEYEALRHEIALLRTEADLAGGWQDAPAGAAGQQDRG